MPPQKSGIADSSFRLLSALRSRLDLVAVVDDRAAGSVRVPEGVALAGAGAYSTAGGGDCDIDVYQMGNHPWFHAFIYSRALEHPGVLTLHDPALVDFSGVLCGGLDTPLFADEARFDDPSLIGSLPTVLVDHEPQVDRTSLMMARRLVESSLATIVHDPWARDELARRYPPCDPVFIRLAPPNRACSSEDRPPASLGEVVFGVFGGFGVHKRVPSVVRAFARILPEYPRSKLVIAGRSDDPRAVRDVDGVVDSLSVRGAVQMVVDAPMAAFEAAIDSCDVVVALRWPSAGETSAIVMRALAAGKPVMVSDLPQYGDLDPAYCWRVPTDPDAEHRTLVQLMRRALEDPVGTAAAGLRARSFAEREASLTTACDRYVEVLSQYARPARTAGPMAAPADSAAHLPAVTVVGDWWATTGLAEAGRRQVSALMAAAGPISVVNYPVPHVPRDENRAPPWIWALPHGRNATIEIWYLNVNEFHVVPDRDLPTAAGRYLIASWFWELPRVSKDFADQIERVDEVWVGSHFVAATFRGHTGKPVIVVPCVIEPVASPAVSRADFGLPDDACLFLVSFDANSFFARKNPWGAVHAFHDAFGPRERRGAARLVVKAMNLDRHPGQRDRLIAAVAQVGGFLLEDDLPTGDMHSLLALCDVYVSLHRSEGFGLGMAEAMYFGRPVIATAYSGNTDFTHHSNSCLVGYRMRPIDRAETTYDPGLARVYEPGQLWAEPDLDQAARWMRRLFERPSERTRVGIAGAETIRERYSTAAAEAAMSTRLREIAS